MKTLNLLEIDRAKNDFKLETMKLNSIKIIFLLSFLSLLFGAQEVMIKIG